MSEPHSPDSTSETGPVRQYLVHYSEVGLKGANRSRFEERLIQNLYRTGRGLGLVSIRRLFGRFLLAQRVEGDSTELERRLARVCGVSHFSPVTVTGLDLDEVREVLTGWAEERDFETFGVRAKRVNKQFPIDSSQLNVELGGLIGRVSGARVDLSAPDRRFTVLVLNQGIFLTRDRYSGAGGLPTGVGSRVGLLLSGGIDSPVAAERLLRRGCELVFIHFHSAPFTDRSSVDKAERLAEIISEHREPAPFYSVGIGELQRRIVAGAPAGYRVLLYRRYMLRIAEKIAVREWCQALGTGESIGQVASQTVDNLATLDRTIDLPVLRPLLTYDKDEIVAEARRAKTFDVSIEPDSDCCSYLMPRRPVTRSRDWKVRDIESKLELGDCIEEILAGLELRSVGPAVEPSSAESPAPEPLLAGGKTPKEEGAPNETAGAASGVGAASEDDPCASPS